MKVKHILLVFGFIFLCQDLCAQAYMVVRKKGTQRRYEYQIGDNITYKQKGWDIYVTDRIEELVDSTIVLENNIILIEDLTAIDIQGATNNRPQYLTLGEGYLPVIGIGLFALDIFNHTVVDGNDFSLDRRTTITSGAMVATGFALKLFRRKRVDLTSEKFEAFIVEFDQN